MEKLLRSPRDDPVEPKPVRDVLAGEAEVLVGGKVGSPLGRRHTWRCWEACAVESVDRETYAKHGNTGTGTVSFTTGVARATG